MRILWCFGRQPRLSVSRFFLAKLTCYSCSLSVFILAKCLSPQLKTKLWLCFDLVMGFHEKIRYFIRYYDSMIWFKSIIGCHTRFLGFNFAVNKINRVFYRNTFKCWKLTEVVWVLLCMLNICFYWLVLQMSIFQEFLIRVFRFTLPHWNHERVQIFQIIFIFQLTKPLKKKRSAKKRIITLMSVDVHSRPFFLTNASL